MVPINKNQAITRIDGTIEFLKKTTNSTRVLKKYIEGLEEVKCLVTQEPKKQTVDGLIGLILTINNFLKEKKC